MGRNKETGTKIDNLIDEIYDVVPDTGSDVH